MLIAIAPLVPIAVTVAIVGGLIALLRGKKGPTTTGEKPLPPDAPAGSDKPPFFRVSAPYAGEATRSGDGWAWSTGDRSGSAGMPMDAIDQLLAAIREREGVEPPDVPLAGKSAGSGTLGGGGNPTLAWSIRTMDQVPGVPPQKTWRLEEVASVAPGGVPKPPTPVADGRVPQGGDAIRAIVSAAADHVDWLMVEGVAPPPAQNFNGLVISGKNVAVADLARWTAHARPLIVGLVEQGRNASEIFGELLGAPSDAKLSGKTIAQVVASAQRVLDSVQRGTYMHPVAPDLVLASALVGVEPPRVGDVSAYKGRVLLVRPLGAEWQWMVFEGQRGLDSDAIAQGTARTKPAAVRRGRFVIDNPGGGS